MTGLFIGLGSNIGKGRKMKSPISPIIVTFILATSAVFTATVQGEDYTYVTNNGTITITGYTGPGGDVTIPSTINSLPAPAVQLPQAGG